MMFEEFAEKIKNISVPCLETLSVELVELKVRRQGRAMAIQILVDKPMGGITMEECATLNRKICEKIDGEGILSQVGSLREEEEYTLEVSSPGVDRALKTQRDFSRSVGRRVRIHLKEPFENRIEYEGRVDQILNDQVIIKQEKHSMAIPIEKIILARQVLC